MIPCLKAWYLGQNFGNHFTFPKKSFHPWKLFQSLIYSFNYKWRYLVDNHCQSRLDAVASCINWKIFTGILTSHHISGRWRRRRWRKFEGRTSLSHMMHHTQHAPHLIQYTRQPPQISYPIHHTIVYLKKVPLTWWSCSDTFNEIIFGRKIVSLYNVNVMGFLFVL